jgi:hypothetical protein
MAERVHGPPAEDIERAFGGRVFGVVGHRGEALAWGGGRGALHSLSLLFTVQGEHVEVETLKSVIPEFEPREDSALVRLALKVLTPIDSMGRTSRPPLPLTLTFEERAARLRVCGREHDFKSYACGGRSDAFTRVGDLWVTVQSPTAFLDSQAFELHDEAELPRSDEPVGAQ